MNITCRFPQSLGDPPSNILIQFMLSWIHFKTVISFAPSGIYFNSQKHVTSHVFRVYDMLRKVL